MILVGAASADWKPGIPRTGCTRVGRNGTQGGLRDARRRAGDTVFAVPSGEPPVVEPWMTEAMKAALRDVGCPPDIARRLSSKMRVERSRGSTEWLLMLFNHGTSYPADRVADRSMTARPLAGQANSFAVISPNGYTARITLRDERRADLDLWTGEPRASKGVAVLARDEEPYTLAAVPICNCGEPDCGNIHRQLGAEGLTEIQLLRLLDMLDGMRWSGSSASGNEPVWQAASDNISP
jgi:hypothetical protein